MKRRVEDHESNNGGYNRLRPAFVSLDDLCKDQLKLAKNLVSAGYLSTHNKKFALTKNSRTYKYGEMALDNQHRAALIILRSHWNCVSM